MSKAQLLSDLQSENANWEALLEPFSGAAFFAHFREEHEPDMRAWLNTVK